MAERPEVPPEWVQRLGEILEAHPLCYVEDAWVGVRWRVGQATIAHVFGGEDGQIRITLRAEPDEVMAFEHMGPPYFKAGWGTNVVGLILNEETDWAELAETLADSYRIQAPAKLAALEDLPTEP